jgi:hypothetical protein
MLGPSNTINKTALKQYRERVTDLIMSHAKDLSHPDLASLKNKIDWLFQDDMKGRRVLPLITVSVVDVLGELLALTPEAIKEVSIVLIRARNGMFQRAHNVTFHCAHIGTFQCAHIVTFQYAHNVTFQWAPSGTSLCAHNVKSRCAHNVKFHCAHSFCSSEQTD